MGQNVTTAQDDGPPARWRAMQGTRPLVGLTVLAVEDSLFASEALRLLCLHSGARVRRADSLASARRHLCTYRPGVVIVDMGLPDGSGAELISTLAAMTPHVPVILGLSGEPGMRGAALAAGAQGFLAKPVESLPLFQQTILEALPADQRPLGLRVLPNDIVLPHAAALRDDLRRAAVMLDGGAPASGPSYLGRFLAGLARSARDAALEDAAEALLAAPEPAAARNRLQNLLRRRLMELSPV